MSELFTVVNRLERLSGNQLRYAIREISSYLHNDFGIDFVHDRSLDQLADLLSALPNHHRDLMYPAALDVAKRFEHVNDLRKQLESIRAVKQPDYFATTYNLNKIGLPDWPAAKYAEVFDEFVVRQVYRMRDGRFRGDTIDGSWNESAASLEPEPPTLGQDDFSEVIEINKEQFEHFWTKAEPIYRDGDQTWEFVDTTSATDPRFEPVIGVWIAPEMPDETLEFTLNGILLWTQTETATRFFRYNVDGAVVILDPENGGDSLIMTLCADALTEETGRRFIRRN
jgi:hypothetical protein